MPASAPSSAFELILLRIFLTHHVLSCSVNHPINPTDQLGNNEASSPFNSVGPDVCCRQPCYRKSLQRRKWALVEHHKHHAASTNVGKKEVYLSLCQIDEMHLRNQSHEGAPLAVENPYQ